MPFANLILTNETTAPITNNTAYNESNARIGIFENLIAEPLGLTPPSLKAPLTLNNFHINFNIPGSDITNNPEVADLIDVTNDINVSVNGQKLTENSLRNATDGLFGIQMFQKQMQQAGLLGGTKIVNGGQANDGNGNIPDGGTGLIGGVNQASGLLGGSPIRNDGTGLIGGTSVMNSNENTNKPASLSNGSTGLIGGTSQGNAAGVIGGVTITNSEANQSPPGMLSQGGTGLIGGVNQGTGLVGGFPISNNMNSGLIGGITVINSNKDNQSPTTGSISPGNSGLIGGVSQNPVVFPPTDLRPPPPPDNGVFTGINVSCCYYLLQFSHLGRTTPYSLTRVFNRCFSYIA